MNCDAGGCTERLVSIVVPVYNGAPHLAECLDSVLAQRYSNWEVAVINNCSTDCTGSLADEYAARDRRIRVVHCDVHLPQAANYDRAVQNAAASAKYVKILEADNWLTVNALEEAVHLAEEHPDVGIVGSYWLRGDQLDGSGVDCRVRVLDGCEVSRLRLQGTSLLGTPSTLLFRQTALGEQSLLFRDGIPYDDNDLCIRILMKWKFGFVHRALCFVRVDSSSSFGRIQSYTPEEAFRYLLFQKYGASLYKGSDHSAVSRKVWTDLVKSVGRLIIRGKLTRDARLFYRSLFSLEQQKFGPGLLVAAVASGLTDSVMNPKLTLQGFLRSVRRRAST